MLKMTTLIYIYNNEHTMNAWHESDSDIRPSRLKSLKPDPFHSLLTFTFNPLFFYERDHLSHMQVLDLHYKGDNLMWSICSVEWWCPQHASPIQAGQGSESLNILRKRKGLGEGNWNQTKLGKVCLNLYSRHLLPRMWIFWVCESSLNIFIANWPWHAYIYPVLSHSFFFFFE